MGFRRPRRGSSQPWRALEGAAAAPVVVISSYHIKLIRVWLVIELEFEGGIQSIRIPHRIA
jgi:hypothetical protein